MNPEPTWQHQVHTDGGRTSVILAGELDLSGVGQLRGLLHTAVRAADTVEVEVDLAKVEFIDSTALSVLIATMNTATEVGCRFAVVNPSPPVRRVLDITGLFGLLTAGTN